MEKKNDYFPAFLDLNKKSFLIIGGGTIATAKLETLVKYTQKITLVSMEFSEEIQKLMQEYHLKGIKETYRKEHLQFGEIVIAATNDKESNTQIAKDCRKLKKIINVVDNPKESDFIFGAIVKKGNLNIAISTSGISPVLARVLKEKIHQILPEGFERLNDFIRKKLESNF